ncbi:alpha-L-glutamate ligase [Kitasatospora sp. NPDC051914]|uniref:ATP-grasp domain-containing protein n=1 Tax=Kitasatospora sp. NPDC051914 TaxID=3154945 RepID=UPI003421D719
MTRPLRVRLLTADPGHPLLAAAAALLRAGGHTVDTQHPAAPEEPGRPDVCLLKARTPQALALAARLEERGVPVVNPAAATAFCQDRQRMADRALAAGLPFAPTRTADLAGLDVPEPVVLKSLHSRRGDLVAAVPDTATARRLAAEWPGEPVVVQPMAANDGWDHKLWAVDGRLFAERRRSELAPPVPGAATRAALPVAELPAHWRDLALAAGEVFGLDVYGVDVLATAAGPLIVDVNAFPGIRGQAGAPEALAALAVAAGTGSRRPAGHAAARTAG